MSKDNQVGDLPKTSAPAERALQSAGITTLKQLANISEAELYNSTAWDKKQLAFFATRSKRTDCLSVM